MNKALIPAFFLLGSLILGVSVMVPQFANAQGEQKVNEQQMQALKLFFNAQSPGDTNGNQQEETTSSNPQTENIEKVREIQQQAKAMQQAQAEQQAKIQAQIDAQNQHKVHGLQAQAQQQVPTTNNNNNNNQQQQQLQTTSSNQQQIIPFTAPPADQQTTTTSDLRTSKAM